MNVVDRIRAQQYSPAERDIAVALDGQSAEQILRSLNGRLDDTVVVAKLEKLASRGRDAIAPFSQADMDAISYVLRRFPNG